MSTLSFVIFFFTASIGLIECFENLPIVEDSEALFLTKYIENNQLELAKNLSLVKHSELEWLTSYAGYLTVNKEYNSNMFFWFFPAKNQMKDVPVLLWLNGGPGVSSLYGLFQENGPFFVNSEKKLEPRQYSWHIDHNLLYIDNPVGTGFSFTESDSGYATNQVDVGVNLLKAVKQFFTLFAELKTNRFYLTGESYSGKYIPALGYAILQNNQNSNPEDQINLQGLAIGNGFIDPLNQVNYGEYFYQMGLIDDNGRILIDEYHKNATDCIRRDDFEGAFYYMDPVITCLTCNYSSLFSNLTGFDSVYNFLKPKDAFFGGQDTFQMDYLKSAIHVGNRDFITPFESNTVSMNLVADIMDSVGNWVAELLNHYEVYLYSGQLDIIVPYQSTVSFIKSLKFGASDEYKIAKRHIWELDTEFIGYVKQAGNLTEVIIWNAGHMVPADQPKWMLNMLKKMTFGTGFHFQ